MRLCMISVLMMVELLSVSSVLSTDSYNITSNSNPLYICTAANNQFFPHLLNLIGSIHKVNFDELGQIMVFDLGLKNDQIQQLNSIKKLSVFTIEKTHPDILKPVNTRIDGKSVPGWYAWKPVAIKQALDMVPYILWLDAGTTILKSLTDLFKHIQQQGCFLATIGSGCTNKDGICQGHNIDWGSTTYIKQKFNLVSLENRWLLKKELITAGIIGVSHQAKKDFVMPLYELSNDIKNFEDDGTTPNGFGTGRHDQTLVSILAYKNDLKIHALDYKQSKPMSLIVDEKKIPFYITWHKDFVSDKTCIYHSRGNIGNYDQYIHSQIQK